VATDSPAPPATTRGVVFPLHDGRRSTSAAGRAIVAAALAEVDPTGAVAARRETAWRSGYVPHFRRLVEAGIASPEVWKTIAREGLAATHDLLHFVPADGTEVALHDARDLAADRELATVVVRGTGDPQGFTLPYRGELLAGDEIRRRVAAWVEDGVVEPSVAPAIDDVIEHPEWLRLEGRTLVACGAGAEMGPAATLLGWGATVAAVDLPVPRVWDGLVTTATTSAGTLLVPVDPTRTPTGRDDDVAGDPSPDRADDDPAGLPLRTGLDLVEAPAAVADWIEGLPGTPVVGNYAYADGAAHVRVSAAIDLVVARLLARRADVALAFLATPTDVFVVPRDAVEHATAAYEARSTTARVLARPLRAVSRGRLLQRNHRPDADPGIADSLVTAQGPNYALAKRIQRWRATDARARGTRVSFHVAPSSRTRSVTRNRALAAAFGGAHRFGVEVFDPETANTLMAALLVRDMHVEPEVHDHPWQDEAHEAAHGGLWRAPWAPPTALGLAAVLGWAGTR
jgi:hypothetical protein